MEELLGVGTTAAYLLLALGIASGTQQGAPAGSTDQPEHAQPSPESNPENSAIIITAARTNLPATALPMTTDVLGGEDFQRQVAVSGSVIDALSSRFPGFSPTREKLSGAGETLRGRSPLFAINGVPQSTPIRDGSRDGYTIDPFFIDRVEVIYGSNALQGIGATGGVVNQVTVGGPKVDGLRARALLQGTAQDGFGQEALGGKAAALVSWRGGRIDVTAGGSIENRGVFLDGEGRRIGPDSAQGDVQDSSSWSLFGRVGYQLSRSARLDLVANSFQLSGDHNYVVLRGSRADGVPTSSVRGRTPGEPPANRAELLSLSLTDEDLYGGTLTAQLFYSRTRDIFGGGVFAMFQDPAIDPGGRLFEQSVNRSRKIGGKLSLERAVPGYENLIVIGGMDWLSDRTAQTLLATGRIWVPRTDFRSLAPFLQGNLKLLAGSLRLAGGIRHENVRLEVPDFTPLFFYGARPVQGGTPSFRRLLKNGGIVLEPIKGLRAYGAYAEGFTIPEVGRILRAITQANVRIDDFLDLRPVVSNNREIGLEWDRGSLEASATYFRSSSRFGSLLVRNADGFFDVVRQPVAIDGLEASVAWRTPLRGLTVGAAYANLDGGTDTDDDGRIDTDLDGANISPDRLNVFADWARGRWNARAAVRHYFPRTFKGDDPRNAFGGYTLVDADIGYRFGPYRLSLSVQNLADEQFITYFSDTQGPADDLRYFAGRGRTFTLAVTSRW